MAAIEYRYAAQGVDDARCRPGDSESGVPATIAVVGGGAAGTLVALQLLRRQWDGARPRIVLIERSAEIGRGVAYSTTDTDHLLNVRAGGMSAYPDQPDHFARTIGVGADEFVSRSRFGDYLAGELAITGSAGGVEICRDSVTDVLPIDGRYAVVGAARTISADAVVLATGPVHAGVLGPAPLANAISADPALPLIVVGTGLTAVDTALTATRDNPDRQIVAVSRHGWLPRGHDTTPRPAWSWTIDDGVADLDTLRIAIRREIALAAAAGVGWRSVFDGMRPMTNAIWTRLPLDERRRFLTVGLRWWEVRRHRMAPQVAHRTAGLVADGRLRVRRAEFVGAEQRGGGWHVVVRDPAGGLQGMHAAGVVDCTGQITDPRRSGPLSSALLARGLATPDSLGIGTRTDAGGALIDSSGRADERLLTLGAPRRGQLWETTAIPEIRQQAAVLADRLAGVLAKTG